MQPLHMVESRVYLDRIVRSFLFAALSFVAVIRPALAQESIASSRTKSATVDELKRKVKSSLEHLSQMQQELDAHQESEGLQQQIDAERQHLEFIEQQLDGSSSSGNQKTSPLQAGVTPAEGSHAAKLMPADIYNGGFFIETADKSYSLVANGLFQVRYTCAAGYRVCPAGAWHLSTSHRG